jgi:hypothetical protein
MLGTAASSITMSARIPDRIEAVKSGAAIFFRSSSTITSLAICRRLEARSCSRAKRSSLSAILPFRPAARASSVSAARIMAVTISCRSVRPPQHWVGGRICRTPSARRSTGIACSGRLMELKSTTKLRLGGDELAHSKNSVIRGHFACKFRYAFRLSCPQSTRYRGTP